MKQIVVELGDASYPIFVGDGVRHQLRTLLPQGARKVAIVTQEGIPWEVDPEIEHATFVLAPGERAKTLSQVEKLCGDFAVFGLTRADLVVGLGGGVVSDVAGFAASIYHRGVAVIHVTTTLLGQVDAAIGGKCGVNLAQGKNLVGSFWQPKAVLCDTETLSSLSPREWASGRGEMAKYAFLGAENLTGLALQDQVAVCAEKKASVVSGDERESGARALLNYGHTLAHALETQAMTCGDDLRHGEAVAIGLHFAARLAVALGRIDPKRISDHVEVIEAMGLGAAMPDYDPNELLKLMMRDKKALNGLTFILDGPNGVEIVSGVDPAMVQATLQSMPRLS